MITDTSLEAFESIQENLGSRQLQVYDALKQLRFATNKQLATFTQLPINSITPRIHELRKKRLVGVYSVDFDGPRRATYWKCVR